MTGPALRHGDLALRAVAVGLSPEVPAWSALGDSGSEKMLGSEGVLWDLCHSEKAQP